MKHALWLLVFAACGALSPPHDAGSTADAAVDAGCPIATHACGASCVADDSVLACGSQCLACEGHGGLAACIDGACAVACAVNQALCNGTCVTASRGQCGAMCLACDGAADCLDGACVTRCAPGEAALGTGCTREHLVATGLSHACVVQHGRVLCWGAGSTGSLGRGAYDGGRLPGYVEALSDVRALISGDSFACARLANQAAQCWGDNQFGQVGNGATQTAFTPSVALPGGVLQLAAGSRHACALSDDGSLRCWGANLVGQLGTGATSMGARTPQVVLDGGVRAVFAGDDGVFARGDDGGFEVWGESAIASFTLTPTALQLTDAGATRVVAGASHACVIRADDSKLACTGRGTEGQLGYAVSGTTPQPMRDVPGLDAVVDVCAGGDFTCALLRDAGVQCFGGGGFGQLGNGSFAANPNASAVIDLPAVQQLSCQFRSACALTDQHVYCWGDNSLGQLGAPTPGSSNRPLEVSLP